MKRVCEIEEIFEFSRPRLAVIEPKKGKGEKREDLIPFGAECLRNHGGAEHDEFFPLFWQTIEEHGGQNAENTVIERNTEGTEGRGRSAEKIGDGEKG